MTALVQRRATLDKAVFIISLDTELAWGSFDRNGVEKYGHYYAQVRDIVKTLLRLFRRYEIKATWAVVGHLFLRSCSRRGPDNHERVLQPTYHWHPQGWLSHDPYSSVEEAPFFYAPDMVDGILASHPRHEIASHTFSHAILGDPECSREVAYSQLTECKRLGREKGQEIVSLVYPRNSIGHLDVLCELGFTSFRGHEANWFRGLNAFPLAAKMCRFLDKAMGVTPPCYKEFLCYRTDSEQRWLCDLPASMFFPPYSGWWTLVGLPKRISQARKGIAEAVRRKALFHLWFHPFNLASSPLLVDALEEVLASVGREVKAGNMESLTMSETAEHLTRLVDGKS